MLECRAIRHRLGRFSLGPISAAAEAGRITAVVGPNASGKSTLLHIAGGVMDADQGDVHLRSRPISALDAGERAGSLVTLPQRPAIDVGLAVERLVSLAQLRRSRSDSDIEAALQRLGLSSIRSMPLHACSVGQAQRAHAARVLAQAAADAVLVLDEPTAPLDHHWAAVWWQCMRAHADGGGAVLVAVHDLAVAAAMSDDAWVMREGELVATGAAEDVLAPARLESVFGARFEWGARKDGSRWLVPSP